MIFVKICIGVICAIVIAIASYILGYHKRSDEFTTKRINILEELDNMTDTCGTDWLQGALWVLNRW